MFGAFESQTVLKIFQIRYCNGDHSKCERFKLASSGTMPDSDLLPDGDRLAR